MKIPAFRQPVCGTARGSLLAVMTLILAAPLAMAEQRNEMAIEMAEIEVQRLERQGQVARLRALMGMSEPEDEDEEEDEDDEDEGVGSMGTAPTEWTEYFERLRRLARKEPGYTAADHQVDSERSRVSSERHDYGLTLSASYNHYPDGIGASETTTGPEGGTQFTGGRGLENYAQVRLSFRLFDQLFRRFPRVGSAEASLKQAEYMREAEEQQVLVYLLEDATMEWAVGAQREALMNAYNSVQRAKDRLNLAEGAGLPDITQATPDNVAEALILYSRVKSALNALPDIFVSGAPPLPADYSVLPRRAPDGDDIMRVANADPEVSGMEWEAKALDRQARALRGNGVEFNVFGGQVMQQGPAIPSRDETSPVVGVELTIPLGARDFNERRSLSHESHARQQEAIAIVERRRRALLELVQRWRQTGARLDSAEEIMLQHARLYEQMQASAQRPEAGRAPEPWQLDLQEAKFWQATAEVWERRGDWMRHVLAWKVFDDDYLNKHHRTSDPMAYESFCAPLRNCITREL